MLARVRHLLKDFVRACVLLSTLGLISCATTKETPRLVDDPDAREESVLPWNKQQKWEGQQGQLAGFSEESRGR